MIFLSIWLGSDLPESYRNNILSNRKLMQPEDTAVLISDRPQKGFEVTLVDDVIASEDKELYIKSFKRVIESEELHFNKYTAQSDWLRFYYCWKNENVMYMDCDLVLNRVPEMQDKPLFAAYKYGTVNICLILSRKSEKFFEDFLQITAKFPRERGLWFGWLNTQIDKSKYGFISVDSFVHEGA